MDFYGTTAQVIPVLLLALVWESNYLSDVKGRTTARFWTKPRVRAWALFMTAAALVGEAVAVLVLADVLGASDVTKVLGLLGVAVLLGSLAVRVAVDVLAATD
jgi:hypothetical protein